MWQLVKINHEKYVEIFIGKMSGAWFDAVVTKAHPNFRKWLGVTLLPQAGVAIGMANSTLQGEAGTTIMTIVLVVTVVYELFVPFGVEIALQKSGEIDESTL